MAQPNINNFSFGNSAFNKSFPTEQRVNPEQQTSQTNATNLSQQKKAPNDKFDSTDPKISYILKLQDLNKRLYEVNKIGAQLRKDTETQYREFMNDFYRYKDDLYRKLHQQASYLASEKSAYTKQIDQAGHKMQVLSQCEAALQGRLDLVLTENKILKEQLNERTEEPKDIMHEVQPQPVIQQVNSMQNIQDKDKYMKEAKAYIQAEDEKLMQKQLEIDMQKKELDLKEKYLDRLIKEREEQWKETEKSQDRNKSNQSDIYLNAVVNKKPDIQKSNSLSPKKGVSWGGSLANKIFNADSFINQNPGKAKDQTVASIQPSSKAPQQQEESKIQQPQQPPQQPSQQQPPQPINLPKPQQEEEKKSAQVIDKDEPKISLFDSKPIQQETNLTYQQQESLKVLKIDPSSSCNDIIQALLEKIDTEKKLFTTYQNEYEEAKKNLASQKDAMEKQTEDAKFMADKINNLKAKLQVIQQQVIIAKNQRVKEQDQLKMMFTDQLNSVKMAYAQQLNGEVIALINSEQQRHNDILNRETDRLTAKYNEARRKEIERSKQFKAHFDKMKADFIGLQQRCKLEIDDMKKYISKPFELLNLKALDNENKVKELWADIARLNKINQQQHVQIKDYELKLHNHEVESNEQKQEIAKLNTEVENMKNDIIKMKSDFQREKETQHVDNEQKLYKLNNFQKQYEEKAKQLELEKLIVLKQKDEYQKLIYEQIKINQEGKSLNEIGQRRQNLLEFNLLKAEEERKIMLSHYEKQLNEREGKVKELKEIIVGLEEDVQQLKLEITQVTGDRIMLQSKLNAFESQPKGWKIW